MGVDVASTSAAPTELSTPAVAKPASRRLISLDLFRGLAVAGMILVDNPGNDDLAYGPIKHAVWNGWTPADFIFFSFMFLVCASMVLSFQARLQRHETRGQILRHGVQRTLMLIALGIFINGFPGLPSGAKDFGLLLDRRGSGFVVGLAWSICGAGRVLA
jgi:predicted acyltransferase